MFVAHAQANPTLAQVLDGTEANAGPAPAKYTTPFLVVAVSPNMGGECWVDAVTNGTYYRFMGVIGSGQCSHLPALQTLIWGSTWGHSIFSTSDTSVFLVYAMNAKGRPKVNNYSILMANSIGPDWGQ
jgi:hypothetical protein